MISSNSERNGETTRENSSKVDTKNQSARFRSGGIQNPTQADQSSQRYFEMF